MTNGALALPIDSHALALFTSPSPSASKLAIVLDTTDTCNITLDSLRE